MRVSDRIMRKYIIKQAYQRLRAVKDDKDSGMIEFSPFKKQYLHDSRKKMKLHIDKKPNRVVSMLSTDSPQFCIYIYLTSASIIYGPFVNEAFTYCIM